MSADAVGTDQGLGINIEAIEAGVLGACMVEPDYIAELSGLPDDFFTKNLHRQIHKLLVRRWLDGEPIDMTLVHAALQKEGISVSWSDLTYMTGEYLSLNVIGNVQELKDNYRRRKVRHHTALLMQKLEDPRFDPSELVSEAIEALQGLLEPEEASVKRFAEVAEPIIAQGLRGERRDRGIPSGIGGLDRALGGGFKRGHLHILAARPGMGKSALAFQWAIHAAQAGFKVLVFSLEMPAESLVIRQAGAEANIEPARLRQSDDPKLWAVVDKALSRLNEAPLWICDDSTVTAARAAAIAKALKARHGLDLIVVDYLQRLSDTIVERQLSRNHLLGAVAKSFANLGRQTDSAVILLSQLNRRVDSAQEKRPGLADLRDSGELEQDADVVAFLYRPGYYDPKSDQTRAELILAKNRHGRQGIEPLYWDAERVRFFSVDKRRDSDEAQG